MNGLKIIRKRSNLTICEIADILNVSRQLVSAWENGRKEISPRRLKQLSDFYGIDESFFGEISEEQKQQLNEKAMFLFRYHDKDIFKYKPEEGCKDISRKLIYFSENDEKSLSSEYNELKKIQEDTLERIDGFIGEKSGHMGSEMMRMINYTNIYNSFTDLLETIDSQPGYLKVPRRADIRNILLAMAIAYGVKDREELEKYGDNTYYTSADKEWVLELAESMENHWNQVSNFLVEHRKKTACLVKELKEKERLRESLPSVEKQIEEAEARHREFKK